jgi:hypothetical protein
MQKLILVILTLAGLCFTVPAFADDTNQVQGTFTVTNAAQKPSDAELQAAAHDTLLELVLYAVFAFVGGLVVAGFAFYGAYKAFGVKGVIGVGIIILFLFFMIGSILSEAF